MNVPNYILTLEKARYFADEFVKRIGSSCERISVTGQLRRECKECNYVELIGTPRMAVGNVIYFDENRTQKYSMLDMFFATTKGLEQNGKKRKILHFPTHDLRIVFHVSTNDNWGKDLCWTTGNNSFYSQHIAMEWNRRGWCTIDGEFRRKKECEHLPSGKWELKPLYEGEGNHTKTPPFCTEEDFFAYFGIDYVEPSKRNW